MNLRPISTYFSLSLALSLTDWPSRQASMKRSLLEVAMMASLAAFLRTKPWFSPKASLQACLKRSEAEMDIFPVMSSMRSLVLTRRQVMNHIWRRRVRAVEQYLFSEQSPSSPLSSCNFSLISHCTNSRNPLGLGSSLHLARLVRMILTLEVTSASAVLMNPPITRKNLVNSKSTTQMCSMGGSPVALNPASACSSAASTTFMLNLSDSISTISQTLHELQHRPSVTRQVRQVQLVQSRVARHPHLLHVLELQPHHLHRPRAAIRAQLPQLLRKKLPGAAFDPHVQKVFGEEGPTALHGCEQSHGDPFSGIRGGEGLQYQLVLEVSPLHQLLRCGIASINQCLSRTRFWVCSSGRRGESTQSSRTKSTMTRTSSTSSTPGRPSARSTCRQPTSESGGPKKNKTSKPGSGPTKLTGQEVEREFKQRQGPDLSQPRVELEELPEDNEYDLASDKLTEQFQRIGNLGAARVEQNVDTAERPVLREAKKGFGWEEDAAEIDSDINEIYDMLASRKL